jgi:hypothetical protein
MVRPQSAGIGNFIIIIYLRLMEEFRSHWEPNETRRSQSYNTKYVIYGGIK